MKRTMFRPQVRSRHPSHEVLRTTLPLFPFRSVVRFGSLTSFPDDVTHGGKRKEVNTVASVKNASDKMRMKELFTKHGVAQSDWIRATAVDLNNFRLNFPVVAKLQFRSKGRGMRRLQNMEELRAFLTEMRHRLKDYYLEEYFPTGREFRVHVSPHLEGEVFSVRKMMSAEAAEHGAWSRNIANGYFVAEFEKPPIWNEIVAACKLAATAVGLDIGACDVLYSVRRNTFVICEINSAPSMQERTAEHYVVAITEILRRK